ncbi:MULTISPECIES: hypothetical protein [Nocardia]|nr:MULTISPECIES: hypothetical protein [Nocardia]
MTNASAPTIVPSTRVVSSRVAGESMSGSRRSRVKGAAVADN